MKRSGVIDNAKFLMIFLVVFGHLIEPIINNSGLIKTIYLSIYSFHMPLFIILSGMLTKPDFSESRVEKNIASILIPFLSFTFLYEIFHIATKGQISSYTLDFRPYWILWFLFSLFIWKLILPIILKFRFPLLASITVAVVAGYVESVGYFLGVSRTLYFFPFFLIGHQLTTAVLSNKFLLSMPKLIFFIILLLNLALFWWFREMPHQWLYGSYSYASLEVGKLYGSVIRLSMYLISTITCLAIIMLIPRTQSKISEFGSNSLYVYIWHGFIVKVLVGVGLIGLVGNLWAPITLIIVFFIALIVTFLLSTGVVSTYTQKLILNPVKCILLKKI